MKKLKPLNLLNNKGLWPDKVAIVDAIKEILTLGRCHTPLPIQDFGRYRDNEWRNENEELIPFQSVDWYVSDAMDESRMQVDAARILRSFTSEPWRRSNQQGDHYDLFVMEEDMFDPDSPGRGTGQDYAVGKSEHLRAAVISTHRIEHIWGLPYGCLKTEVMRQMCFMFGVPDGQRDDVTEEGRRIYCTNVCILRSAHEAPGDWEALTEDRIRHGALCPSCQRDLQRFFDLAAQEGA